MLLCSLTLITYIAVIIRPKFIIFIYFYPLIVFFLSFFYNRPFLELGDNVGYTGPLRNSLAFYDANDNSGFLTNIQTLEGLSYLKIGFLPIILIPDYLYDFNNDIVYYFFQALFFLFLVAIVACYISKVKSLTVLDNKNLITFLLLSPTIFLLGSTPSRTFFTLFSLVLFIVAFIDLNDKITFRSFFIFFISIIFTIISKQSYLIAYLIFLIFYYRNVKIRIFYKFSLFTLLIFIIGWTLSYYSDWFESTSATGLGNFNSVLNIPIIGPLSKYFFNILSPFPFYRYSMLSDDFFGGNVLFFLLHILSFILIVVMITNLIVNYRSEKNIHIFAQFGLIMSLTILPASAGFNGYIAIFYPFFSNYFISKNNTVIILITIIFLLVFNIIYYFIFN